MIKIGTKKVVICVDYDDIDRLIQDQFEIPEFEIVAAEECGNDTTLEFNVGETEELDEWDIKDIKNKKWQYRTGTYLQYLVNRKVIEAGIYMVNVSW